MIRYIYKLTSESNKSYVGQRTFKGDRIEDDNYMGSSTFFSRYPESLTKSILIKDIKDDFTLSLMETICIMEDITENGHCNNLNGKGNVNGNLGGYQHNIFYLTNLIGVQTRRKNGSYVMKESAKRKMIETKRINNAKLSEEERAQKFGRKKSMEDRKKMSEIKKRYYANLSDLEKQKHKHTTTEETKQKMREAKRRYFNSLSDEERKRIYSKPKSIEYKKKISEKQKEYYKNLTDEEKKLRSLSIKTRYASKSNEEKIRFSRKISEVWNSFSEEKKRNINRKRSAAAKGRIKSKDTIEKIRISKIGHTVSEETRRKISETKKANIRIQEDNRRRHQLYLDYASKYGKITWNNFLSILKVNGGITNELEFRNKYKC